jgi:hypothetical protein
VACLLPQRCSDEVFKKQSHQVLVSFKIASSGGSGGFTTQQVTLRKRLVESARHLCSSCPGQQLRVVAAKTQAQNACEDSGCPYYVGMDKYLGRCGLLVLCLLDLLVQKHKY